MELIIGLIVLALVGYVVFFRKKEESRNESPTVEDTPYKVEPPAPVAEVALPVEVAPVLITEEVPVKKPRKPRTPKAVSTPVKAVAKKAAPKKAAAIKAKPKSKKI